MRILTFTELFPTSADPTHAIFIFQRSLHLAKRPGNEVVVVSPVPYFPRWLKIHRWRMARELPSQEELRGLVVHHPRYFLIPKISMAFHALSMFLGSLRCVKRLNRQERLDCIDAHFVYPDGLAAVLLGKMTGLPVTVSARGTDINVYPSFRLIRPMIRWTLSHADSLIAVSRALKDRMVTLGADPKKIRVIPNGVDTERFRPTNKNQAKERLNLPLEIPLVVSVGALIPSKGHRILIRAFAQISRRHPSLRLYVLGEGPLRSELESLIRELGMQDRIELLGKRSNEELPQWFSAAEVSCLTSEREGWPNVVTESLACGTPVIATRVGGIPEILHSRERGIMVDQTAESIAEGLEQALHKNWDREGIARETRARSWATVAEEVEAVFATNLRARRQ